MAEGQVLKAAAHFITRLEEIDRELRKTMKPGMSVPQAQKDAVLREFWDLIDAIGKYDTGNRSKTEDLKRKCREILGPWLFRSDYFNRSFSKPHGYAGDYQIIEWIYDLEDSPCKDNPCNDQTKPAIVNCLDYVFSQLPSVQSAWDRRRHFANLLTKEYGSKQRTSFRILDVACGSSRYTSDFLLTGASSVEVTLLDQDPAALEYCRTNSLSGLSSPHHLKRHCFPVKNLPKEIPTGEFDVVISAGLFDYLPDDLVTTLLNHMITLTIPGGATAVANFNAAPRTRTVLDWLVDWPLVYRTEDELSRLFPKGVKVEKDRTKEIVYALARPPVSQDPPQTTSPP